MAQKAEDMISKAEHALRDYLEKRGMRPTQERMVVVRAVCALRQFTMEELKNAIVELPLSQATVYNTVELLQDAGIIHQLEKKVGNRLRKYELITAETASYIHVICERCGRVASMKDPTIMRSLMDKKIANFNLKRYSLYLYGTCKVCRRKVAKEGFV